VNVRSDPLRPNRKVEHPNTLRHGGRRVAAATGTQSFVNEAPSVCALILTVAISCASRRGAERARGSRCEFRAPVPSVALSGRQLATNSASQNSPRSTDRARLGSPPSNRPRGSTGKQRQTSDDSPRRERRSLCRCTRARSDLSGQVTFLQRIGARAVATHVVDAIARGAVERIDATAAVRNRRVRGGSAERRGRRVLDTLPIGGAAGARRAASGTAADVAAGVARVGAADGAAAAELAALAAVVEFGVTDGSRTDAAVPVRAPHPTGATGSGRARSHRRSERERDGDDRASDANHRDAMG